MSRQSRKLQVSATAARPKRKAVSVQPVKVISLLSDVSITHQMAHTAKEVFPKRIRYKHLYSTLGEVMRMLKAEAESRQLFDMEYDIVHEGQEGKEVVLKCRSCDCAMTFTKLPSNHLMLLRMTTVHKPPSTPLPIVKPPANQEKESSVESVVITHIKNAHGRKYPVGKKVKTKIQESSKAEQPEAELRCGSEESTDVNPSSIDDLVEKPVQQPPATSPKHSPKKTSRTPLRQTVVAEEDESNIGNLENWLRQNDYTIHRNKDGVLLTMSKHMRQAYSEHWSGILHFDLFSECLTDKALFGLFSVHDQENAILAVGLATVPEESASSRKGLQKAVYYLFQQFFSVHSRNRYPATIMTRVEQSLTQIIGKFIKDQNIPSAQAHSHDIPASSKQKVFYGLECNYSSVRKFVMGKTKLEAVAFFRRLHLATSQPFSTKFICSPEVQLQFEHPSITPLLGLFGKCAVVRFVENYLRGLKEYILATEKTQNGHNVCVVQRFTDGTRYEVRDGSCICGEMQQTGVACSHLIIVAISNCRSYETLIDNRWRRLLPSSTKLLGIK